MTTLFSYMATQLNCKLVKKILPPLRSGKKFDELLILACCGVRKIWEW